MSTVIEDDEIMFGGKPLCTWHEEGRDRHGDGACEDEEEERGRPRERHTHDQPHHHHHHGDQHHKHEARSDDTKDSKH